MALAGTAAPTRPGGPLLDAVHAAACPRAGSAAGVRIVVDDRTYRLAWDDRDEHDALRFLRLAQIAAMPAVLDLRLERLAAAEAAYGGAYLPQWPYEEWAAPRRAQVEVAHQSVLERLAALAEAGQHESAILSYRRLIVLAPERECLHRSLMRLYIQLGERGLALRQFEVCATVLRRELETEPGAETCTIAAELRAER